MPLIATRGASSVQGFGQFAQQTAANYIEDVFSTYLYTGTGSAQTITNGVDLSTKGGLVWFKGRSGSGGTWSHALFDTIRGVSVALSSNLTNGNLNWNNSLSSFGTSGFTLGSDTAGVTNTSTDNYVSWTFRKQPKFFDIVTYTGDGNIGRTVAHNLGSVPGCIIVKQTDVSNNWFVYHRSVGNTQSLALDSTAAAFASTTPLGGNWNSTTPTSTVFTLGGNSNTNSSGGTYIAYLFAHDAGGFGLAGTDNVISCGSFVHTTASTQSINLGYEPQWVLLKRATGVADNWFLMDIMRGMTVSNTVNLLNPNTSDAESASSDYLIPTATGFDVKPGLGPNGNTWIYMAIRRGPMKVPTLGTSVFNTVLWTGNSTNNRQITGVGFSPDYVEAGTRSAASGFSRGVVDRLRGISPFLVTYEDGGESLNSDLESFDNDGITVDYISSGIFNNSSNIYGRFFKRAPGFFDMVCYSGSGSSPQVLSHNLTVTPEMMIVKFRDGSTNWYVYHSGTGNTKALYLGGTATGTPTTSAVFWNNTSPTSTQFTVGSFPSGAGKYVAYLFATCAGVSKVGSYTGTGTTLQVNCGFTAGARFILIKRTDSTGDWYIWDSARGIIAGNDPYLLLNSSAAEVTNTDYIDTYSAGFELSSTAPVALNASGGTYIFLAIA